MQSNIEWCNCKHTEEEKHKVCQVACICKKCGKPIKHTEETKDQRNDKDITTN